MDLVVVEAGREAFERGAWGAAYELLVASGDLDAEDLERLAIVANLTGHDDESVAAWEAGAPRGPSDRGRARGSPVRILGRVRPALPRAHGPRRRLARPCRADGGGGRRRVRRVGVRAHPAVPARARVRPRRRGPIVGRPHRRHRPSLRRRRPARARPALPGRGGGRARRDRRGHAVVRRRDGVGDIRGGVADPVGDRLLRRHRSVRRCLRSAPGRGVDRRARRLVRAAAGPRARSAASAWCIGRRCCRHEARGETPREPPRMLIAT